MKELYKAINYHKRSLEQVFEKYGSRTVESNRVADAEKIWPQRVPGRSRPVSYEQRAAWEALSKR